MMDDIPIYVVDFEGSKNSGVLEYGLVVIQNNEISEVQTALCSALKEISEKETRLHHITNEDVKDQPSFSEYVNLFCQMRKKGPFCAHHAVVENNFLKQYVPYPGNVPDFLTANGVYSWGPWVDTLQLYKYFYPDLESYKLMDLISLFQLEGELKVVSEQYCPEGRRKAHCALFDALASWLLLKQLLNVCDFRQDRIGKLITLSASSNDSRLKLNQLLLS